MPAFCPYYVCKVHRTYLYYPLITDARNVLSSSRLLAFSSVLATILLHYPLPLRHLPPVSVCVSKRRLRKCRVRENIPGPSVALCGHTVYTVPFTSSRFKIAILLKSHVVHPLLCCSSKQILGTDCSWHRPCTSLFLHRNLHHAHLQQWMKSKKNCLSCGSWQGQL
jgi:hypothetical protein